MHKNRGFVFAIKKVVSSYAIMRVGLCNQGMVLCEVPLFHGIFTPYDPSLLLALFWEQDFCLIWGQHRGVVKLYFIYVRFVQ